MNKSFDRKKLHPTWEANEGEHFQKLTEDGVDINDLRASITEKVIVPAEAKVKEIEDRRKLIEKKLEKS